MTSWMLNGNGELRKGRLAGIIDTTNKRKEFSGAPGGRKNTSEEPRLNRGGWGWLAKARNFHKNGWNRTYYIDDNMGSFKKSHKK